VLIDLCRASLADFLWEARVAAPAPMLRPKISSAVVELRNRQQESAFLQAERERPAHSELSCARRTPPTNVLEFAAPRPPAAAVQVW
jgi:hypothetical protein